MYTWELKNYIEERGHLLTREEHSVVVSRVNNPQIQDVKSDKERNITMVMEHGELLHYKCK